jgi:hypothetical protein
MQNLKVNNFFFVTTACQTALVKAKAIILLFFVVLFFNRCATKTFDTQEDLWSYLKEVDNGYLQEKNINGYNFSLLYKPTDLLVAQELEENPTQERINELREKYKKQLYFTLSMSRNGKELLSTTPKNRHQFGAMVNQLAFGMREKVTLFTQKKDTLELLDYIYPRMYGMSQATAMLFVYPKEEKYLKAATLNFTIQDLGTYTGEVKFKIDTDKIKKQPNLKF